MGLEKQENGKYQVDDFMDAARDWFHNLQHEQDDIIIAAYMKAKGIKEEEVGW